jgi:hypothetical protein
VLRTEELFRKLPFQFYFGQGPDPPRARSRQRHLRRASRADEALVALK